MLKREKGITLIALVVTIIVLLILAAVSLSMLTGENGILTNGKLSKNKTEEGGVREEVELAIQEIVLEKRYKEELTTRKIGEYLAEKLEGITIVETTEEKIKIEYKGYEIEITSNWKVKIIGKAGITVTHTTEPTGYAKDAVEIILNIQTREGVSVKSVIPENTGVETIEANKRFKVTENRVYQFKLTDNSDNERTIQIAIDNIDRDAPNAQIDITTKLAITNSKVKAKVTIKDEKSGVDIEKCKWVLKDSETAVGTDIANYIGGKITSEEGEIETGVITEAKKYYIHILVTDKVGNAKEYCSKEIDVKSGYAISTPQEFQDMKKDLAGNYYIVNDIEMKDFNFTTIPGDFTGTLDGQGYTVSNLRISGNCDIGIFAKLSGNACISNLILNNVDLWAGLRENAYPSNYNVGALAATVGDTGDIGIKVSKVGINGKMVSSSIVSAFIGFSRASSKISFDNCYSRCCVTPSDAGHGMGVLTTAEDWVTVNASYCYSAGIASGKNISEGFVVRYRRTDQPITLTNCYYNKDGAGGDIAGWLVRGTGLTTAEMGKQESYVGWDFENTWKMGQDGYPELRFNENN